jgi:hypothetical protein
LSSLGEYAIVGLIEAYTSEGDRPPEWTGKWYDDEGHELSPLEYFEWKTGLDDRAVYKCIGSLKKKGLIEVEGEGKKAKYRTRPDRYRQCQPRSRGGWTRKGPRSAEEAHNDVEASVTADNRCALAAPKAPIPVQLDCPMGLTCPVESVRPGKDGVLHNIKVIDNSLNSSSAKEKRNSPWEKVKTKLRTVLGAVAWSNWIEATREVAVQAGVAIVAVENAHQKTWIEQEYSEQIAGALVEVGLTGVRYVVSPCNVGDSLGSSGSLLNSSSVNGDAFRERLRRACSRIPAVLDDAIIEDIRAVLSPTPEELYFEVLESAQVQRRLAKYSLGVLVLFANDAVRLRLERYGRGLLKRLEKRRE